MEASGVGSLRGKVFLGDYGGVGFCVLAKNMETWRDELHLCEEESEFFAEGKVTLSFL